MSRKSNDDDEYYVVAVRVRKTSISHSQADAIFYANTALKAAMGQGNAGLGEFQVWANWTADSGVVKNITEVNPAQEVTLKVV